MMAESSSRADGAKLRAARDAKGWSQEELAKQAGYALSVIQKLEQGTYFSLPCLECCATALGARVADLLVFANELLPPIEGEGNSILEGAATARQGQGAAETHI